MKLPEILAPAGSVEALTAAVNCGADAVYLGGKSLNARRNAGNFDDDALERGLSFCHARGVKVYQTLNIVMFDSELDEAMHAVETAARLGVDGVMVQDLGLARLVARCAPQMPMFASTQMAVHNLEGVLEAERLGCKRVVLARELCKEEIAKIASHCTAQLEVFVHGALCMSVSGQCYMSAMLGERSGNRGLCAQPCRLPFRAGERPYALSLKDLSLVERVQELVALGVASLKIEGRMKRPEYVAAAVTALRQALNGEKADMETLRSVFSRNGFTSGYFDGRLDGTMFGVRDRDDVVAAEPVLRPLAQLATREMPRVILSGTFLAQKDSPISLSLCDSEKNQAVATGSIPEAAHTRATSAERVRQSLEKMGGTPFMLGELTIKLDDGLMLQAAALNALRREALTQLEELRSMPHPIPFQDVARRDHPKQLSLTQPTLRARCTAAQLSPSLLARCDDVILPHSDVEAALGAGVSPSRIIVELPRVLYTGGQALSERLMALKAVGVKRAWAGNLGSIPLARETGFAIEGGWTLNLCNSHALATAAELGLSNAEISIEMGLSAARHLGDYMPYGLVGYGRLPLMIFRNCPMRASMDCSACGGKWSLTDRRGISFPLRCRGGMAELLNSLPLWMADRRRELTGFAFMTLWFTDEDAAECARVAEAYSGAGSDAPPASGHTRGLYFRQVL